MTEIFTHCSAGSIGLSQKQQMNTAGTKAYRGSLMPAIVIVDEPEELTAAGWESLIG